MTNGNLTFTPVANYNGPASITYTVNDNSGATSNVATVSITVTPVNDAPVAEPEAVALAGGKLIAIGEIAGGEFHPRRVFA